MKPLCFLIPILLYISKFICSHHLNVGTVLFTKSHLCKKCWTASEMKLLSARQVMQGVLPDPDFIDISKTGTITVLLEYFQSCFEAIGQSSCRKSQHLMFLALADALGGYLRSYILPLTRQAYYAGHVKYFEAKKVYQFYEELKEFLKTNGAGWAKPRMCTFNCKIRPLKISTKGCDTACSQLYLRDEAQMEVCRNVQSGKHGVFTTELSTFSPVECDFNEKRRLIDIIEGMRSRKECTPYGDSLNNAAAETDLSGRSVQKIEKIRKNKKRLKDRFELSMMNSKCRDGHDERPNVNNSSVNSLGQAKYLRKRNDFCRKKKPKPPRCRPKQLIIPLPTLDDPITPSAIGLPFRVRPLRSLCSPHAICILVRYYITVIRCMVTKTNNRCDLCNFNAQFQSWLSSNVFPHLNDEEWYPAFGGVLRIEETIKSFGSESFLRCKSSCSSDIGYIFSKGYGFEESDYGGNEGCPEVIAPPCRRKENRTYLTLGIVVIVLIWLVALCYCICCHCSDTKCDEEDRSNTFHDPVDKKKADLSNSFIVQCLIKFFRRAEQGKEVLQPTKENINYNVYYGDMTALSDADQSNRPEHCRRSVRDEYRNSRSIRGHDLGYRRSRNNRETIVLPAQINRITSEMPTDYNSFWPVTDFRGNTDARKYYPDEGLKCLFGRNEPLSEKQRRGKEQFHTLWKREKSAVRTSESCEGLSAHNVIANNPRDRLKRKADVLSRSSYSDSGDSNMRVVLQRRSRSGFDRPDSYLYSYNSSSASYSSSQAEDNIPVELFGHIMACHNSFAKKARMEVRQKPQLESESERSLTSSSSSEESFSSVKRIPQ